VMSLYIYLSDSLSWRCQVDRLMLIMILIESLNKFRDLNMQIKSSGTFEPSHDQMI
jgi:hypothetical protein